ncbi:MAG: hypothetical protein WCF50_16075, partial [Pseudolabrys sp.]
GQTIVRTAVASDTSTLSSAAKKSTATRRRAPSQVACTELGCHAIPPGCRPQMGYNWDGIPTGFDIVVCGAPPGRQSLG